ncbi:MAG: TraB/GumN family protein [Muribaculaceae bacterium]|nr:TraB/GumN family protein [Muribaculaceae bacterium]
MKRIGVLAAMSALCIVAYSQLLWRVSDGEGKSSYVFGTHHFTPANYLDSIPGFAAALDDAQCVIVEIEQDSLNSPKVMQKMMKAMIAPADSTLSKLLTPEDYALVSEVINNRLKDLGMKVEMCEPLKPSAIVAQMDAARAMREFKSFDVAAMIDGEVQRRAQAMGKPCKSLETADFQIDLLLGGPLDKQAADLVDLCRHDNEADSLSMELIEAYRLQDLKTVGGIMFSPALGGGEDYEALLYARNERWIPIVSKLMREGSVMMAVGAGHLIGDRGVLQLLRNAGFTVTPVE